MNVRPVGFRSGLGRERFGCDLILKRDNESGPNAVATFDPSESGMKPWLVVTVIPP